MQNKYKTFWPRFYAALADSVIFFPFLIPEVFWDMKDVQTRINVELSCISLWTIYSVIGHGLFGYTIGKRLFKVKLLDRSERTTIGIPRAFLRESIGLALYIIAILNFFMQTKEIVYIQDSDLENFNLFDIVFFGWFTLEFLTMLTNPKRRAIHDYIAGSVVIRYEKEAIK